jgi:hypothetical protein
LVTSAKIEIGDGQLPEAAHRLRPDLRVLIGLKMPMGAWSRICTALRFTRCWLSSTKCQATGTAFVVEAGPQKIGSAIDSALEEGVYCELVSESEISEVSIPVRFWAILVS